MSQKKHHNIPVTVINSEELKNKIDYNPDVTLINVLDKETYIDCHIPHSINIPYESLIESLASWDKDKEIVLYCAQISCPKSRQAYELLADLGFTHVYEYSEGMRGWLKKGFDTTGTCTLRYLHE